MIPAAFVGLDALPITASGKVDRRALPEPPEAEVSDDEVPHEGREAVLAELWHGVLGRTRVGRRTSFFEAGGDSILVMQLVWRARARGLDVSVRDVFAHPTIAELAAALEGRAPPVVQADQGPVTGEVALTPVQRWFSKQEVPERSHYNQSLLIAVRERLDPERLRAALAKIVEHHDQLRARFEQTAGGAWREMVLPVGAEPVPLRVEDECGPDRIEEICAQVQASLSIEAGRLVAASYFDAGDGAPGRLLLVIHHLVIDGVSWRVLLEDLEQLYGGARALPPKTASVRQWSARLLEHARSERVRRELPYWSAQIEKALPVPVDGVREAGTIGTSREVTVELEVERTRALLGRAHAPYRTQIDELLLAALVEAFRAWTGSPRLLLQLESHGRHPIRRELDVTRTIGWLTSLYPVRLDVEGVQGWNDRIHASKSSCARSRSRHRLRAASLRVGRPRDWGRAPREPGRALQYLGRLDQTLREGGLFAPAKERAGDDMSGLSARPALLEIVGATYPDGLRMTFRYEPSCHHRETIERLAGSFIAALEALIDHCSRRSGGYGLSDFARSRLTEPEFDSL